MAPYFLCLSIVSHLSPNEPFLCRSNEFFWQQNKKEFAFENPLRFCVCTVERISCHINPKLSPQRVLFSLFSLGKIHKVGAVAAHDYWFANPIMAMFSKHVMNLVPVKRKRSEGESVEDILANVFEALNDNKIIIFFPEGSRGEPERRSEIKAGIDIICKKFPTLPVHPVFLHGLGKIMPRGDPLFVPFFCDVVMGEVMDDHHMTTPSKKLKSVFDKLEQEIEIPNWD